MGFVKVFCASSFQMCNIFKSKKNEGEIKKQQEAEYEVIEQQRIFLIKK